VARLLRGQSLALISDAGTPLVSDPGYRLVRAALEQGIQASPIPGPSAIIAALSVCGLPTDRFVFEGFLPVRTGPRRTRLETLRHEPRTLVFFESCHRIAAALVDLADLFGANRPAALARELTKVYESVRQATLGALRDWVSTNPEQRKGEMVLVVAGDAEAGRAEDDDSRLRQVLVTLLDELPAKQAATLAARLTKSGRNYAYKLAIELQSKGKP
jgi:16S rRNA (cytidine1402-2'-O)-methyltransferase